MIKLDTLVIFISVTVITFLLVDDSINPFTAIMLVFLTVILFSNLLVQYLNAKGGSR